MTVISNIGAAKASFSLTRSNARIESSLLKLSTGSKINSASDDAAGLAMKARMSSQIKGLSMAVKNAMDATSLLSTADGALAEVESILQRMRELSIQSSNGTHTAEDRSYMDMEYQQLKAEINRIGANTQWNGTNLLDDKGFPGTTKFQVGANASQTIEVELGSVSMADLGVVTSNVIEQVTTTTTTKNEVVDATPWTEISVPEFTSSGAVMRVTAMSGDGETLASIVRNTVTWAPNEEADLAILQLSGSEWLPKGSLITLQNQTSPILPNDIDLSADGNVLVAGFVDYELSNIGVIAYEFIDQDWSQLGSIMTPVDTTSARVPLPTVVSGDGRTVATNGYNPSEAGSSPYTGPDGTGVYVFKLSDSDWVETEFQGDDSGDRTGISSISLSHDGSVIAFNHERRPDQHGSMTQHGYVATYDGTLYPYTDGYHELLYGYSYELGQDFAAHERLGISSDGARYVASSPLNRADKGYVTVYEKDAVSGNNSVIKQFFGELDGQEAGHAVAISGDGLTIAYVNRVANPDVNMSGGSIKIFKQQSSGWVQQGSTLDILSANSFAYVELSHDGNTLLYWDIDRRETRTWLRDAGETTFTEINDVAKVKQESLADTSVLTQADAHASTQNIDHAVADITSMRATYGATINRLEHAIDGLTNTRINLEASVSRITDTNYAEETAELVKAQIINRASIAMLAQAQMRHDDMVTLIRGVVN